MNILITGANRGIGLALTELYLQDGHQVFAACRSSSPELEATNATVIEGIDVTSIEASKILLEKLSDTSIDVFINNAGILSSETLAEMDMQAVERQMQVNAFAPLQLSASLLPLLKKGSKLALITSRMGSIEDNGSGGYYGYRMSKAALNAAGKSLAIDLKPLGIAVALLHPGMVSTRMINFHGDVSPKQAAAGLIARIDELNLENSGTFWHANGKVLPW